MARGWQAAPRGWLAVSKFRLNFSFPTLKFVTCPPIPVGLPLACGETGLVAVGITLLA